MSEHAGYLDRMTARLAAVEHEIGIWCERAEDARQVRDLQARLAVLKERLQTMRRAGGEATAEMTQSFTQAFERLRGDFVRVRTAGERAA